MTNFRAREADGAKTVTNRRLSISSSKMKNFIYIVWLNSQSLPFLNLNHCIQVFLGGYFFFFLSANILRGKVSSIYTPNPIWIQRKLAKTTELRNLREGSGLHYSGFLRVK